MPGDDRATKSAERCDLHPGSPSVALCESCGRPLCLACAIPVRGGVRGSECMSDILGVDAALSSLAERPRPRLATLLAGLGFAAAVLSTALPWSRFGEGSGAFGAWDLPQRWSTLAAASAVVGLALWVGLYRGQRTFRSQWHAVLALLAGLTVVSALLALLRPPPFTHGWLGPWIASGAGLTALLATLASRRSPGGPRTPGS